MVSLTALATILVAAHVAGSHNRLRAVVAAGVQAAGLGVEVEKPGLLPLRPDGDGAEDGGRGAGHRRPADVRVAQWGLHGAAAFDLAVTSGLRAGAVLAESARSGVAAAEAYEARKRTHLQTEQHCKAEGLQFVPLVAEASSVQRLSLPGASSRA